MPREVETAGLLAESMEPLNGSASVRIKKGGWEQKDVYVEVWNAEEGFVSSLKVTEKLKMIYDDAAFGGISWSRDGKKVCFIGEKPAIAEYKPFFRDAAEAEKGQGEKEEECKKAKGEAGEHWQDEKFQYVEHFGETLSDKRRPVIFIFDLSENRLDQVRFGKHLGSTDYPSQPVFDKNSKGIVFSCLHLPIKKLGLNFCLNRPATIEHI